MRGRLSRLIAVATACLAALAQAGTLEAAPPTEAMLIEALGKSAEANDGEFFETLDWESIMPCVVKLQWVKQKGQQPGTAGQELARSLSHGLSFAWMLPKTADARYAGKGVRRGEPGRPIFWYKPEKSEQYRVIYADLTVEQADRAPEVATAVRVEMPAKPSEINVGLFPHRWNDFPPGFPDKFAPVDVMTFVSLSTSATAMQVHAAIHRGVFPATAIRGKDGQPLLSWRVMLLPYLQEQELYERFHLDEPWDSEHNQWLATRTPRCYQSARPGIPPGKTTFLAPTGKETIFCGENGTKVKEISDGLTHTIAVVEADVQHAVPWTKPEDLEIDPRIPVTGLAQENGQLAAVSADGMVVLLPADIDPATLWAFFTRAGGEKVKWPKLPRP